jgi:Na+-translocating ferredoxin:NAD+ oxidoreductase RnfD subunit
MPDRHDPRLKLSLIVSSLQVLGQTVLGFKVSVAQILVSVGVAAVVDALLILRRDRVLTWPASGLLTGNSVVFILRAAGTRHGDWWSKNGIHLFVACAVVSVLSKHLIRLHGRHVFNPSNVGLVGCFLAAGLRRTYPQYLWWGPFDYPVVATLAVIAIGAVWIARPLRMLSMVTTYLAVLGAIVAVLAARGHSFFAIWHFGPVKDEAFFVHVMLSPELFVFVLFMLTDPQTVPRRMLGRVGFGAAAAAVSGVLIAFQHTEFGVKVAILAGLTVVSGVRALAANRDARPGVAILVAALTIGAAGGTAALGADDSLVRIERGLSGSIQ